MQNYSYAILDPRPIDAAKEANDKIFNRGSILGIEVTVPALAEQCGLGNIDPQHSGKNSNSTAIEEALHTSLPSEGSTLVTIRPDLDALGAMTVLTERKKGIHFDDDFMQRVKLIADADRFANKGKWEPKPLPTELSTTPLQVIGAAVTDFKLSLEERIQLLRHWLINGEEPAVYRSQVTREEQSTIDALASGEIQVLTKEGIALVTSTHRAATAIGYTQAPVVIAMNPAFSLRGGKPHKKFTLCQFAPGYCDIKGALHELSEMEAGWGGSPTIGGSPQGISSQLSIEKVWEITKKYLQ